MNVDTDIVIDEKIEIIDKTPRKYNVIMLNDDFTPMEWVLEILKQIYKHSDASAESLTMTIHTEGSAIVGSYSYEIAEMKSNETIISSRHRGFPLKVEMEAI